MPSLSEQEQRRKNRADRAETARKTAHDKAKIASAQARAAARASRKKGADMIGETIVLACEEGNITPQLLAGLGELMAARKDKPINWDLVEKYFPAPSPARPAIVPDPVADAAE
jgi:hypothetical protein